MALVCGHSFCEQCILNWRKKQTNCPLCRDNDTTSAFLIVNSSLAQTMQIRHELLSRVRYLVSHIIK